MHLLPTQIAAVLTLFSVFTFSANNASAEVPGSIDVYELELRSSNGDRVVYLGVGEQVSIRTSIHNNLDNEQTLVILIEVRDDSGLTEFLAWQSLDLAANANYTLETSWIADSFCGIVSPGCNQSYLRSFVVTEFENPQVLSMVTTSEAITVIDRTVNGSRLYTLALDGKDYEIEYAMDSGFISNVTVDKDLTTLSLHLEHMSNNTDLILVLPGRVVAQVLSCGLDGFLPDQPIEPVAFIDSIQVDITILNWQVEVVTLMLSVEAGAEEVELAGTCIA